MNKNKKILIALAVVLILVLVLVVVKSWSAKKNLAATGKTGIAKSATPSTPGNPKVSPGQPPAVTQQVSPQSQIYLDPAQQTVKGAQNFSLNAKINPQDNKVTAVEMHVTFDPAKFQVTGVSSPSDTWSVLQAAKTDNVNGTASIIIGIVPKNPIAPVTQPATTVATINFKVVGASGTGQMDFASTTRAAAEGSNSNVIVKMTGAQVTIGK